MRTLILHIGAHKTGTSSIQHYLKRSRAELARANWRFIYLPGALNLAQLLAWDQAPQPNFRLQQWALDKLVGAVSDSPENCIMSSEDLFFLDSQAEIQHLQQTLAPLFDRIEIIVYLRRQDRMALSLKAQGAKTIQASLVFGDSQDPLPQLTPAVRSYLDYHRKLTLWAGCFGQDRLRVRIFEPVQLAQGDAVLDFIRESGLPLVKTPVRRNESLGEDATCFLQTLRQEGIAPSVIWPLYRAGYIERRGGALRKPSRQQAVDFQQQFASSNTSLARELNAETLFSDSFQSYPDSTGTAHMDQAYALRNCAMMTRRLEKFCGVEQLETLSTAATLLAEHSELLEQLQQLETAMKEYLQQSGELPVPGSRPDVVTSKALWQDMQHLITLSQVANDTSAQLLFNTARALRNDYPRIAYRSARMAWFIRPYGVTLKDLLATLRGTLKRRGKWTLEDEATRLWLELDALLDVARTLIRAKLGR